MPSDLVRGLNAGSRQEKRVKQKSGKLVAEPPCAQAVLPHGNKTRTPTVMCVDRGLQCGGSAGSAWPGDASGPNRAAIA